MIQEGSAHSLKSESSRRHAACPAEVTLQIMGGRWKPVILYWLRESKRRFGELHRLIPEASQQVLTMQLRQLEADGLVHREVFKEIPPKVEYSLTELGQTLSPVLDALCTWAENFGGSDSWPENLPEAETAIEGSRIQ